MMTVELSGTIQQTINRIPRDNKETVRLLLPPGTYRERVEIRVPSLILEGESPDNTVIVMDYHASENLADGERRGTFRSYTMFVGADHITLRNLTVRNDSSPRREAEQALALYENGDDFLAENCRFESFQDTLFLGPLPKKELQPKGFTGPGEFSKREIMHQHFTHCVIAGDVDFIFGSGAGYFESCRVISKSDDYEKDLFRRGEKDALGYVCAPSTYEGEPYGFIFQNCSFEGDELPKESVYLARPWRDYGKCVLINCRMDAHIKKEGFHDWNKKKAREECFFAEYGSTGEGAGRKRVSFAKMLRQEELKQYETDTFNLYFRCKK